MEPCMDFLHWLGPDMSLEVLTCLDDPSDLVRVSSVSRSWRHFVIEKGLCKNLCIRMFPQLSRVASVIELNKPDAKKSGEVGPSSSKEFETLELEREHRAYALLAHRLTSFDVGNSIQWAVSASSTDNDPDESIYHTLVEREEVGGRPSYWSSKGQRDPAVSETLIYKLVSDFVVVTEINIKPFRAYFQPNEPIYSANGVRFRMGHSKSQAEIVSDPMGELCHDDRFVWMYTSQVFPMTQESRLQNFKLPEPVLCIGGFLQIELLGRVQRQEMDNLFYICVSYVEVKGKSVAPAFCVEVHQQSQKLVLIANLEANGNIEPNLPENDSELTTADAARHLRQMMPLIHLLHGHGVDFEEEHDWDNIEDGFHGVDFEEEHGGDDIEVGFHAVDFEEEHDGDHIEDGSDEEFAI